VRCWFIRLAPTDNIDGFTFAKQESLITIPEQTLFAVAYLVACGNLGVCQLRIASVKKVAESELWSVTSRG